MHKSPIRFSSVFAAAITFAILTIAVGSTARAAVTLEPAGDTFGTGPVQHDIASIVAVGVGGDLEITVNFNSAIAAPSTFSSNAVGGYIAIDIDSNLDMGAALFHLRDPSNGPAPGIDFYIDLFSEEFDLDADPFNGLVDLLDLNQSQPPLSQLPISYGLNSLTVVVPFTLLGIPDDGVNLGVIVGTFPLGLVPGESTDQTPDAIAASTPEPASLAIWSLGALALGLGYRRRMRIVRQRTRLE